MKYGMMIVLGFLLTSPVMAQESVKIKALEDKVATLEERLARLEGIVTPVAKKVNAEQVASDQQQKARERMKKDLEVYSAAELREIESLYQVANTKWRTQQGKGSLELLIKKYDKANRTGCALLYLGQMSKGEEKERYLEDAIDDYSPIITTEQERRMMRRSCSRRSKRISLMPSATKVCCWWI